MRLGKSIEGQAVLLIQGFREAFSSFPKDQQASIRKSASGFFSPCQIIVIHSKHPRIECLVVAHIEDEPDAEIHLYESTTYDEFFRMIETRVLHDRICSRVGKTEVEMALASLINNAQQYNIINSPFEYGIISGQSVRSVSPCHVILLVGSILEIDAKKEGRRIASDARTTELIPSLLASLPKEKIVLQGLGTRINPGIWIGSESERSFHQKALGSRVGGASGIEFKTVHREVPLFICRGGYFAVGTQNKEIALSVLNDIAASLMIVSDLPVVMVRENDLGEARFGTRSSSYSGGADSASTGISAHPILVTRETIIRALDFSKLMEKNAKLSSALRLALQALTHWKSSEWGEALLTSWIFLEEIYINKIWSDFTSEKVGAQKKRLEKLENYSVDWRLEAMNLAGRLSDEEFGKLMKIKNERNRAVHGGVTPQKEIVGASVNLMMGFIRGYSKDVTRVVK